MSDGPEPQDPHTLSEWEQTTLDAQVEDGAPSETKKPSKTILYFLAAAAFFTVAALLTEGTLQAVAMGGALLGLIFAGLWFAIDPQDERGR